MNSIRCSTSLRQRAITGSAASRWSCSLRLQEVAERALQLADDVGRKAAPHQADRVGAEDARRPAADGPRVRQRVLGDHRVAADEGVTPDPAELVHPGPGADVGEILDRHVAAECRHIAENRVVSHVAVVSDVHVGHEHIAVADFGDPAAAAGAAVNGHELAENVLLADDEARFFAAKLQVLRNEADRRERKHLSAVANLGPAVDDGRCPDGAVGADPHPGADERAGADRRPARPPTGGRSRLGRFRSDRILRQQLALGDLIPARWLRARRARAQVISSRSRSPGTTCRRNFASLTPRR